MPLGRFGVKNEYGLGAKELYKDGVECEDPKAVLNGVAVAGLVGLLRQLGDLSQFGAEVFHGLQEQVASTASRSRKLVTRVQRIEASLPSLEKAILSQTSHIHYAYLPGSEWHPRIKNEHNHFVCDDLPHFVMDSYEECHEPPRLQLLDRFDAGGPGSCLKKYTDPTFFRRASASSEAGSQEKSRRERKAHKNKRRSRQRIEQFSSCVPVMNNSGRVHGPPHGGQVDSSLSQTGSSFDRTFRSDLEDQSDSFRSKISTQPVKAKKKELSSTISENMANPTNTTVPPCTDVTWDEKLELLEHMGVNNEIENVQNAPETNCYLHQQDLKSVSVESINQVDSLSESGSATKPEAINVKSTDHVEGLPEHGSSSESDVHGKYSTTTLDWGMGVTQKDFDESQDLDESNSHEHDLQDLDVSNFHYHERDLQDLDESKFHYHERNLQDLDEPNVNLDERHRHELGESNFDLDKHGHQELGESNFDLHEHELQDLDESKFDLHERDSMQMYSEPFLQVPGCYEGENTLQENDMVLANCDSLPQATRFFNGESSPKLIANGNFVSDPLDSKLSICDVQYMLDTINNEKRTLETTLAGIELSRVEHSPHSNTDDKFVNGPSENKLRMEDAHYMLETNIDKAKLKTGTSTVNDECDRQVDTSTEKMNVNTMNLLEWSHHEEMDSETDNFVDALYTIDSESESEYETQIKKKVELSTSKCELLENVLTVRKDGAQDVSGQPDAPLYLLENASTVKKDGVQDVLDQPIAPLYLSENAVSSHHSEAVKSEEQDMLSCFSQDQPLQSPPSLVTFSQGVDACVDADEIKLQGDVSKPVESTSQNFHDDKIRDMQVGSTSSYPVNSWSNGTLFGLQPSKPTVISSMSKSDPFCSGLGEGNIFDKYSSKIDGHGGNLGSDSLDVGSLNHMSHDVLDIKYDKSLDREGSGHLSNTSEGRSSLLSLLGRNILEKGLRRSVSLDYDDKKKPNETLNSNLQPSSISPPPSPPLELMKISFRPIYGFETSKLKLKYPEGIDQHESTVETFPSFQLVPESTRLHHEMGLGSDSDDDTFCRSHQCVSENSVDHLSDSDSEQWESGDSSESNEHASYDGLRRISSTKFVSSSSQDGETDEGSIHVGPTSLSSGTKNFGYAEMKVCLNLKEDSFHLQDLTPQLPPLPPLQWRVSRPLVAESEDKPEQGSETSNQSFDSHLSERPKLQSRVQDSDATVNQRKLEAEPKVRDRKQNVHAANVKTMDESEDFLHQIRTKSFNLKRTNLAQSLYAPSPATSNKVSAILQKASAIRQAVGSDGEDDSSWSDT